MKTVTQETYADAGLRQAERMLLSLKESLSEKRPDVTISCRILRLQNSREDRKRTVRRYPCIRTCSGRDRPSCKEYYEDSLDGLGSAVSKWMSQLTAGKYDHAIVKEDGKLLILADGKEILPEALSHGTLEQIYLAFRLAVGEIVTKEEPMPVIFDETFGMYDENV